MVMVYYPYREFTEQGRKTYSNFHTSFSVYRQAQEIFDDLGRILDLAGKFGAYGTITEIIRNFDRIFANYPLKPIEQTELYELRSLYLEYYGSFICLTEFQKFFNSLGTSTKTVKWIEGIMTQLIKLEIDLMWDSQLINDLSQRDGIPGRSGYGLQVVLQMFHGTIPARGLDAMIIRW